MRYAQKWYAFNMLALGITLSFIGKLLLGVSVVLVHRKITKERRIDGIVLMQMKHEQLIAIAGILLMIVGYLVEMMYFGYF